MWDVYDSDEMIPVTYRNLKLRNIFCIRNNYFLFCVFLKWVWYNKKDLKKSDSPFQLMTPLQGMEDLYQQAGDSLQRWITCIIMLIPASVECSKSYHSHRFVTENTKCSQS